MNLKKKDLEIALEKIPEFLNPDPSLEQYSTPSIIATDILFNAYTRGDINGLKIMDLGCGTGIFSIGTWFLGANEVVGYDISESALGLAKEYAKSIDAKIEFKLSDVENIDERCDTVFMNPPFGCQNKKADRIFLNKAMELSDCVYSIHMANTLDFVEKYSLKNGRNVTYSKTYKYEILHTFSFHKKKKHTVDIVAVNIR